MPDTMLARCSRGPAAAVDSPRSDVVPFVEVVNVALLVTFLVALLHPAILNPFQVEPHVAWTIICYAFGLPILIINGFVRRALLAADSFRLFDVGLCRARVRDLANELRSPCDWCGDSWTGRAVGRVWRVRVLAGNRPALARVVVAALVGGIAMLEWTALAAHLRFGLEVRVLEFPPLEWSGREGLGLAAAIQFGLLIGIWQRTRSYAVQIAAIVLILAAVVECLFMYSRVPWAAMAAALIAACLYGLRIWRISAVPARPCRRLAPSSARRHAVHDPSREHGGRTRARPRKRTLVPGRRLGRCAEGHQPEPAPRNGPRHV